MSEAQHSSKSSKLDAFRCLFALDLIPYKLFCFFLYGAYGSLLPYLPLYIKQLGIEAFEAGVITGIRPMVQIIGAPFFGAVADRYRMGKVLLLGGVCGWIFKALLILVLRPHNQQCISLYDDTTANVTATYVNVKPLWDKETEGKHIWTLLTAENPIIVEKSKTILKYSSQELQQVKHKAHGNSFLLRYELKKRRFSDLSNDLNGNATRIVETGVLEKVSYGRFVSRENSGLRTNKMLYPNEFLHPRHKKLYAAKMKREPSQKETQKAIVRKNPDYINLQRKQSGAEKHVTSLYPRQKKWQRFQSRLKEHGLTVTHIVNTFEPKLNKTLTHLTQIDNHELYYMFVIFTLFIIVGEFLESPTYTLSDSSLLDRLGEDREYYGNIRMFGSLGWALTSVLVGYLVAATAFNLCEVPSGNYLVAFYIFIFCCSVAFFCVLGFTFNYNSKKPSGACCREVGQLLLNLRFSSFLVSVLFVGWCYGFLIHFVNWFIDDLKGSPVIMGVAGAARELTGLAFFFIGGSVISVLGHINTMVLCLLAYMALFYCYSVVINPWFVVGLEMMAGANYALAWSTCVNYTNRVGSALGVTATVQGLLQAVFWGFGNGGGSVLSGALYHYLGPTTVFQIFTVASGITVLYLIITCKISEKLKVPDLTNMGAFCDMRPEKVKPSRDADNHEILDTSENESLEDEPFLFLQKKK